MNGMILSAALMFTQAPAPTSKVVGASLFKNGFAVVVRETAIKNGEAIITELPQASLGTLWISSSPNVTISEATTMIVTEKGERDAVSFDEILMGNIGKEVSLNLGAVGTAIGKVVSASGPIVILIAEGQTTIIPKASIQRITASIPLNYKLKTENAKRVLRA